MLAVSIERSMAMVVSAEDDEFRGATVSREVFGWVRDGQFSFTAYFSHPHPGPFLRIMRGDGTYFYPSNPVLPTNTPLLLTYWVWTGEWTVTPMERMF